MLMLMDRVGQTRQEIKALRWPSEVLLGIERSPVCSRVAVDVEEPVTLPRSDTKSRLLACEQIEGP